MRAALLSLLLACCACPAPAADVPPTALRHRADLIRTSHAAWGLDAPTATFAAQIHTESQWRPNATSPVGATGMAQFMPTTADWISRLDPELAANQPTNPAWAMRALVTYDKWLFNRIQASDDCQRMAFALSAYNGGLGWIQRDKKAAKAAGAESLTWFGEVERFNAGRNQAAFRENRAYPRLILKVREPVYAARGFGKGACHE